MKTLITFIIILVIGSVSFKMISYFHTETFISKVTSKERITKKSGDNIESFYLVYTDKGTLKLEDDVLRGNWESSDVYGKLKNDSSYTFTTTGFRFGLFSMYPNIIGVQ
jgi:hypothetical protein